MDSGNAGRLGVRSLGDSPLNQAPCLMNPGPVVRIVARLRRSRLDRALSEGADPAASPLIAARASQLTGPGARARIAAGLERLARSPDRRPVRFEILPPSSAILANRGDLLDLADMLRRERNLYARGIAMLMVMLTDGAGPAYTDRQGAALARGLRTARVGLTG